MAEERSKRGRTARDSAAKGSDPEKGQAKCAGWLLLLAEDLLLPDMRKALLTTAANLTEEDIPLAKFLLEMSKCLRAQGAMTAEEEDSFAAVLLQSFGSLDVVDVAE